MAHYRLSNLIDRHVREAQARDQKMRQRREAAKQAQE